MSVPLVARTLLHGSRAQRIRLLRLVLKRVWSTFLPLVPLPTRLPFGGWWFAWNDSLGDMVFSGDFEKRETAFVGRFLQPGMTVLDVGAHHGFYTLLASKRVAPRGLVIAFEPSPRERRKLFWHLRVNRCHNVTVESFALGKHEGQVQLYLVEGKETGFNSLCPPDPSEPTKSIPVHITSLDKYLRKSKIDRVHLIKVDIEGAELDFLKGAQDLLHRYPRPVILCEVQDIRTKAWGYRAKEIVTMLRGLGFRWFRPSSDGSLESVSVDQEDFDGNFVAIPRETVQSSLFTTLGLRTLGEERSGAGR